MLTGIKTQSYKPSNYPKVHCRCTAVPLAEGDRRPPSLLLPPRCDPRLPFHWRSNDELSEPIDRLARLPNSPLRIGVRALAGGSVRSGPRVVCLTDGRSSANRLHRRRLPITSHPPASGCVRLVKDAITAAGGDLFCPPSTRIFACYCVIAPINHTHGGCNAAKIKSSRLRMGLCRYGQYCNASQHRFPVNVRQAARRRVLPGLRMAVFCAVYARR